MRLKQTGALLLASVMMVGTIGLINPVQAQAATPTNQYTLTVPAVTELNYDGTAVALANGLKVSGGDLEEGKKVTVTAESANDWKLVATGVETKISYGLYATTEATETTTSWDFSKTEAAGTTGTTKPIYSKIVASEYQSAAAGEYSDTITFTAEVVSAAPAVSAASALVTGAQYKIKYHAVQDGGIDFETIFEKEASGFRIVSHDKNSVYGGDQSSIASQIVGDSKIVLKHFGNNAIEIDTAANTYKTRNVPSDGEMQDSIYTMTQFLVKPAGASEFVDITNTISSNGNID